jgi:hypothetical protein
MVSRAGHETEGPTDKPQIADFTNRSFRRFEVHGGYIAFHQTGRPPKTSLRICYRLPRKAPTTSRGGAYTWSKEDLASAVKINSVVHHR